MTVPEPPDEREQRPVQVRLRRLRVLWLPLLLIVFDALLVLLALALALVVLPLVLAALALVALLRWLLSVITFGRLPRRRRFLDAQEPLPPAGRGVLSDEERRALAVRLRPFLSLYPEDQELGPPYRGEESEQLLGADYHPRSVSIFLDHVRLRHGRTQWLPDLPDPTPLAEIRASLGRPGEEQSSLEIPWLHGGHPLKIVRHLFPFARQLRAHWALPVYRTDCGCSQAVWQRYCEIIRGRDSDGAPSQYPHTFYARVLEGRELPEIGDGHPLAGAIAIQYWWFLFYNDAWNRHQGDWEGITVFVNRGDNGLISPVGAAYACHDLGRWRRWQDLIRVNEAGVLDSEGLHPVVYTARGSHASYFDRNDNGYHPHMTRRLRLPFIGDYAIPSRFVLESRNAIDWVADVHTPLGAAAAVFTENVELLPPERLLRDLPALRADDHWWWLAYRGLWGAPEFLPFFGGSGPRGPMWQGLKWRNPFQWVMRECIADEIPYWVSTFARWNTAESGAGSNTDHAAATHEALAVNGAEGGDVDAGAVAGNK